MRGIISPKLEPFLLQVNQAIADAKQQGIPFSAELVRTGLNNLSALLNQKPEIVPKFLIVPVLFRHAMG